MIEYAIILLIAIVQIAFYLWIDKHVIRLAKIWVLIGFLIAQLFVFPQLLLSLYGYGDEQCGMPIVAIHLFFLLLGGSLNLISHAVYYFIKQKNKTYEI